VKPLKNKTPAGVQAAIQEVLDDGVTIQSFETDLGSEYKNGKIKEFLEKNHIRWHGKVG
jgi:hypothetical protein